MDADPPDMSTSTATSIGFGAYMTPFTPSTLGRPSSPLNPHAGSSSPLTSPTPQQAHLSLQHQLYPTHSSISVAGPSRPARPRTSRNFSLPSPGPSSSGARFGRRPTAPAHSRSSLPAGSVAGLANAPDIFTEGTSPVQGQLWRDRLGRRMEERERRKSAREEEMGRRRDIAPDEADQEAADRRAQEDDEEIFRRLMVLQRRKAEHAALVSHEMETGGSDPLEPDFWEDEMANLDKEERELSSIFDTTQPPFQPPSQPQFPAYPYSSSSAASSSTITPPSRIYRDRFQPPPPIDDRADVEMGSYRDTAEEEEEWAEEAAAAEEAEREAEEVELLERIEREYGQGVAGQGGHRHAQAGGGEDDMGMDWDELERMDME